MLRSLWFERCVVAALVLFGAGSAGAVTLLPTGFGTIHDFPELGSPRLVHFDHINLGYSKTTDVNRQIQRAFLEFAIGAQPVASARLELDFLPGSEGVFELCVYDEHPDLILTAEDFDRSVTPLAAFDPNTDGTPLTAPDVEQMTFDVTDLVNASLGSSLGFQVRVQGDLARTDFAILGGQISAPHDPRGAPRLVFEPVPEPDPAALLALGLVGLGAARRRR